MAEEKTWSEVYEGNSKPIWVVDNTWPEFLSRAYRDVRGKNPKVFDIGCGLGYYSERIAEDDPTATITGIDISSTAITRARERTKKKNLGLRIAFFKGDFLKFDFQFRQSQDFAFDYGFFHHVNPKRHAEYRERLLSLLKEGGTYLMVSFAEDNAHFDGKSFIPENTGIPMYRNTPSKVLSSFTPEFTLERFEKFTHTLSTDLLNGFVFKRRG